MKLAMRILLLEAVSVIISELSRSLALALGNPKWIVAGRVAQLFRDHCAGCSLPESGR